MNSLLVTLFLNEFELICWNTVKWFQVLLSNANSPISTQLNGSSYCYLTSVILFLKYSDLNLIELYGW